MTGRVANCLPLGNDGKYFLIGVALYTHGNVWGIADPPEDWNVAVEQFSCSNCGQERYGESSQAECEQEARPYNLFSEGAEAYWGLEVENVIRTWQSKNQSHVLFFRNFANSAALPYFGIWPKRSIRWRHVSTSENQPVDRPFRVKLRGSVLALVRLPNRRSVRAAIHQLSTSGGVIHLEKPLDEKLEVELIFHLREATSRQGADAVPHVGDPGVDAALPLRGPSDAIAKRWMTS